MKIFGINAVGCILNLVKKLFNKKNYEIVLQRGFVLHKNEDIKKIIMSC